MAAFVENYYSSACSYCGRRFSNNGGTASLHICDCKTAVATYENTGHDRLFSQEEEKEIAVNASRADHGYKSAIPMKDVPRHLRKKRPRRRR